MTLRLEQSWTPDGARHGVLTLDVLNAGAVALTPDRLCLSTTTLPAPDAAVRGGRILRQVATHVELALDGPVEPGATRIEIAGFLHPPTNRTQGAMAAWLEWNCGRVATFSVGDLAPPDGTPRGPVKDWPAGRIDLPLSLVPWPARVDVSAFGPAPVFCPAAGCDPAPFAGVAELHRRLFPAAAAPLSCTAGDRAVAPRVDPSLPPEGYRLRFGPQVDLAHADADGLRHGLIALAQMAHAARCDPRFAVPRDGEIADAPRFGWRGCHLDVARNFHGPATVARLLDILAWLRMNRFHWHLTDDEGWRLPSRAFPDLTRLGAVRMRGGPRPPQYSDGPEGQTGAYTEAEIGALLSHAGALGIAVMPEIDMPGHATALLHAVPGLRDPAETADSYRSIQGFANNALNPGLARTYDVVQTLLAELGTLFPDAPLHIGGDEVDAGSWSASPLARALAERDGLTTTQELQAHFMRRVHAMVAAQGRVTGAWDEAADGGGIDPQGALLFAWRSTRKTAELIAAGYDVVATPGQAYYLDMVQGAGWDSPGMSWAGAVPPRQSYDHDPAAGLPDGPGRLIGVQAGLWTEHLACRARLNDMMFPRLAAVAEAGWTPQAEKSWDRFAALSRGVPQL